MLATHGNWVVFAWRLQKQVPLGNLVAMNETRPVLLSNVTLPGAEASTN
jgi:hypothetical protein